MGCPYLYICAKNKLFRLHINNSLKKDMVRLLSVALLLLITRLAQGQTSTLSGSVTTPSGQPVVGVSLSLAPGDRATMTDEKGNYLLADVPFGTYTIAITSLEIQSVNARVMLNQTRQRKNFVANPNEGSRL